MKAERYVGDGGPMDSTIDGVRRGGPVWPPAGNHLPQRSSLPSGGPFFLIAQKEWGERRAKGEAFRHCSRNDMHPPPLIPLPRYSLFLQC